MGMAEISAFLIFSPVAPSPVKECSSGVSVGPGQTLFSVTPLCEISRAMVLVKAMMPPLQAE
ncbi:hypothetical protein D3C83_305510 [compost metagenome]